MIKGRAKLEWTPEMAMRFWDFEQNFPERYFTYRHSAELVRQLRRHLQGQGAVLDYGCGPGYLLGELLAAGIEAAGLDFSPETVRGVKERLKDHPKFAGAFSPDELAASGRRFDVITVVEVIEHLYDDPLDRLLADLGGLLAPQGLVLFTTPNEEDLEKSSLLCPVSGEVFHRWQHVRSWSRQGLIDTLEARDYRVLECFTTSFRGGLSRGKTKGTLAGRWAVLKSDLARHLGKKKKPPHLVAIARPR
jgi:2-polyprenyl-3-methyl-5-hydroxy-6-metoxy-1,4-benzoquinol methylase